MKDPEVVNVLYGKTRRMIVVSFGMESVENMVEDHVLSGMRNPTLMLTVMATELVWVMIKRELGRRSLQRRMM